ncbi:family 1 glycosylhydrolase [Sphingomonas endolithica]|uniref:family 1 glycosylhydrolase n=1 Tax=Sphingomonas endolithica TaxID=2972485 RepID=UPI0021AE6C3C|nr:family 1 glycosylhydrolase [Sphingomonas sp. ZFBP2030]
MGNRWFDQTRRSGHEHRIEDLALFADLGICKLRYPALWERISPADPERCDFRWTDERLPEIRRLGMEPILTLCHHGSGPHYTGLLQDSFAHGLAHHAAAVTERYPWVEDYTPVNEPLTTARFSALYGFWYPHLCNETAFWVALLNETDATRLAMRAIRRINPAARLVQTDDLGFCHASPPLQHSADFQNERRWMGWDLLCGMVVPGHALWERLVACGLEDRLRTIADDPCPPDVIGVNHYLSSERLLDHRIDRYGDRALADGPLGATDGVVHVDVDAVRNLPDDVIGLAGLIEQAWERYRIPVAITECHLGATREEQARWFIEAWSDGKRLRRRGVDLRAVTAWSLLGAYDWNRMVTRFIGQYEPGVFDVRGGTPRPTLMARVLKDLASGRCPDGPGLQVPGWWGERRDNQGSYAVSAHSVDVTAAPLMIVGDDGVLTALAIEACEARGLHYMLSDDVARASQTVRPWAMLDTRVQAPGSALDPGGVCPRFGIYGAFFTTEAPVPGQLPAPGVLAIEHGPVFIADDDTALPARVLDALDADQPISLEPGPPWKGVYGPSLIDGVLDLLLDGAAGHMRFIPAEQWSRVQFRHVLANVAGYDTGALHEWATASSAVSQSQLPPMETVLERFVADRRRLRRAVEERLPQLYLAAAE